MPARAFRRDRRPESGANHYSLEKIIKTLMWIKNFDTAGFDTERLHHLKRALSSTKTIP
jgi:hypothetical protein